MQRAILYLLLAFAVVGCKKGYNEYEAENINSQHVNSQSKQEREKEAVLGVNKVISEKESQQIKKYIERRKWQTTVTGGVFVNLTKRGEGKAITDGAIVKLEYTLGLITGEKLYDSSKDGAKIIRFGKSDTEPAGLLHTLLTMRMGDEANLIIPSYLGYGLYGDGNKISGHATLVYSVRIVDVK